MGSTSDSTKSLRCTAKAAIDICVVMVLKEDLFIDQATEYFYFCDFSMYFSFCDRCNDLRHNSIKSHPQEIPHIARPQLDDLLSRIRRHSRETHRKWRLSLCVYKRLLAIYNGRFYVPIGPAHQETCRPAFYWTCRPAFYRSRTENWGDAFVAFDF